MKKLSLLIAVFLLMSLVLTACSHRPVKFSSEGVWRMGFGSAEILLPEDSSDPLYIAGYHNGWEIDGVLDMPCARAVWMDTGEGGVLLIGIDCVGVGSGTVAEIRRGLSAFCRETGCVSVNVYATHTHAGIDTLGLWGPVAIDGKNEDYMKNLMDAAIISAEEAYASRTVGRLYLGSAVTDGLQHDSRQPAVYDPSLYQLRFAPDAESQAGIRLLSYAAHAESLRGDNRYLSRDFPGALADGLKAATGDDVMFLPGAIGGLIMTHEFVEPFHGEKNMKETANRLIEAALSVDNEEELDAALTISNVPLEIPLDNTFFFFGKFLGILENEISRGESDTGYLLHSELGVLQLGGLALALIPGEIFPELVSGEGLGAGDPEPLSSIALRYGAKKLIVVGLSNDELGYIIPPSAFMLNEELPFIEGVTDETGENHYEETNSTGIHTAALIASAFEKAMSMQ